VVTHQLQVERRTGKVRHQKPTFYHCATPPTFTNHSTPIQLAQCRFHALAISNKKGKGSPYSITERRVPELIPVLGHFQC